MLEPRRRYRARRACGRNAWRHERSKAKANRVAQQVKASSGADSRTGSSVREDSLRGVRSSTRPSSPSFFVQQAKASQVSLEKAVESTTAVSRVSSKCRSFGRRDSRILCEDNRKRRSHDPDMTPDRSDSSGTVGARRQRQSSACSTEGKRLWNSSGRRTRKHKHTSTDSHMFTHTFTHKRTHTHIHACIHACAHQHYS